MAIAAIPMTIVKELDIESEKVTGRKDRDESALLRSFQNSPQMFRRAGKWRIILAQTRYRLLYNLAVGEQTVYDSLAVYPQH